MCMVTLFAKAPASDLAYVIFSWNLKLSPNKAEERVKIFTNN